MHVEGWNETLGSRQVAAHIHWRKVGAANHINQSCYMHESFDFHDGKK